MNVTCAKWMLLPLGLLALCLSLSLAAAGSARAALAPVKLVPSTRIAGSLEYPKGIAVSGQGDVYIADDGHHRVQEFNAAGEFVLMFGKEVNATTKGDICTEKEIQQAGVECKAGANGTEPGAFYESPLSLAIDPNTGNLYVQDLFNWRIQEFTASGEFVLMIGKEVNATTKGNLCTEQEIEKSGVMCEAGVRAAPGSNEPGAFNFSQRADVIAVGGPEHLLYVGDERRLQLFDSAGASRGDIPLYPAPPSQGVPTVFSLAVDENGDAYVLQALVAPGEAASPEAVVRELNPEGEQLTEIPISPSREKTKIQPGGFALDSSGYLAFEGIEEGPSFPSRFFGALYETASGREVSEFTLPEVGVGGSAFNAAGELYVVSGGPSGEVLLYRPVPVAEVLPGSAICGPGGDQGTSATFDCTLGGEVNPENVAETAAAFEWGATRSLGESTPAQTVATGTLPVALHAAVSGLRPNQVFYYRLAATDRYVKPPERLPSATVSLSTPPVAPRSAQAPEADYVTATAAALFSTLNPENASTEYFFEYAPCAQVAGCAGTAHTDGQTSAAYGEVAVALSAVELEPSTTYSYRLVAVNAFGQETRGPEASFATAAAPSQTAVTQPAGAVTTTTAALNGSVNPDGARATYAFQVGVDRGAGTVFSTVAQGATGPEATTETFMLSGLQPGMAYAYRIVLSGGYGTMVGDPVLFTTAGLPGALLAPASPALLAIPTIAFPTTKPMSPKPALRCKRGYKRGAQNRCVRRKQTRRRSGKGARTKRR